MKSKQCPNCKEVFIGRTKYCCPSCKWRAGIIRKEENKFTVPKKFANERYFRMAVGSKRASSRGQGKRVGGMVKGAMAAMVNVLIEEYKEVNSENVISHMLGIPGYYPSGVLLGNGQFIRGHDIEQKLNVKLPESVLSRIC